MVVPSLTSLDAEIEVCANADTETAHASSDSMIAAVDANDGRRALATLAKTLLNQQLITSSLALERLDQHLLELMGTVASATLFAKKMVKINTALHYKQQKYNLLREESEGFSRLLILLASTINLGETAPDIDRLYSQVLETIGFFDLDPNKVLDILLDEFTFGLAKWQLYVQLLRRLAYPSATITGIIGFKLAFLHADKKAAPDHSDALFTVIALLLAEGMISLDALYPHVSQEKPCTVTDSPRVVGSQRRDMS